MSEQMGGPFSNTAHPRRYYCRQCGKPEHGSLACHTAPSWPINIEVGSTTKDALISTLEAEVERFHGMIEQAHRDNVKRMGDIPVMTFEAYKDDLDRRWKERT